MEFAIADINKQLEDRDADYRISTDLSMYKMKIAKENSFRPDNDLPCKFDDKDFLHQIFLLMNFLLKSFSTEITLHQKVAAIEFD